MTTGGRVRRRGAPGGPETPSCATAKRWRARARRRWPTYLPDVAYAIEGVPQPKRQHGRTWADFDREEFLTGITLGVPPWYREAWRPEHRPRLVTEEEIFSCLTADQRATYCA